MIVHNSLVVQNLIVNRSKHQFAVLGNGKGATLGIDSGVCHYDALSKVHMANGVTALHLEGRRDKIVIQHHLAISRELSSQQVDVYVFIKVSSRFGWQDDSWTIARCLTMSTRVSRRSDDIQGF